MSLTRRSAIALLILISYTANAKSAILQIASDTYKTNAVTRQWDIIIAPEQNLIGNNTNYVTVLGSTQTKTGGLNILGSLGVGTTSPFSMVYLLERSTSAGAMYYQQSSSVTSVYPSIVLRRSSGAIDAPMNFQGGVPLGAIRFEGYSQPVASKWREGASIIAVSTNSDIETSSMHSYLQFNTLGAGSSPTMQERLRIDEFGAKVSGSLRATDSIYVGNLNQEDSDFLKKSSLYIVAGSADPNVFPGITAYDESLQGKPLILNGGTTGFIGIETQVPSSKLDVFNGSVTIRGTNAGLNISGIDILGAINSTAALSSYYYLVAISSITTLQIATGTLAAQTTFNVLNPSNTNYLTVLGSTQTKLGGFNAMGNVGIGTTNPAASLDVVSANYPVIRGVRTSNVTNAVRTGVTALHSTSGDMTDGFGGLFTVDIQDNSGVVNNIADFGGVRNGADNTGDAIIRTYTAGSASEKMRVTSGGNVGIGTLAPANKLHIVPSDAYSSGWLKGISSTGTNVIENGNVAIGLHGDKSIYFMTKGLGDYTDSNWSPSVAMRIQSDGNVGIGTLAPAGRLHVGTTDFIIDSNGNVGIGTNAPFAKFHLEGAGDKNSNAQNRVLALMGSTNYIDWQFAANAGNGPSIDYIADGTVSNPYASILETSNHQFHVGGNQANPAIVITTDTPKKVGIGIDAFSFASGAHFQIGDSSFVVTSAGNVGIGFSTPTQRLEIADQTSNGAQMTLKSFRASSGSNSQLAFTKARGTIAAPATVVNGDTVGQYSFNAYDGTSYLPTASILSGVDGSASTNVMPGNLVFRTNGGSSVTSERMRIDSAGNVGIGTNNPVYRLHMHNPTAGSVEWTHYTNGTTGATINDGMDVGIANSGQGYVFVREAQPLYLGTNNNTQMTVLSGGNVGLGNTSPHALLDVTGGNMQFTNFASNGITNSTIASIDSQIYTNVGQPASFASIRFITDPVSWFKGGIGLFTNDVDGTNTATPPVERMRIAASGNVGIGTSSPGNKLHIFGSDTILQKLEGSSVLGSYMQFTKTDATDRTWSLGATGSSSSPGDNLFALVDETASSAFRFLVDSSGNIAIGQTAPSTELYINKVTPEISLADGSYDGTAYSRIGLASASAAPTYTFYRAQNATHDGSNWVHVVDGGFNGKAVRDYLYNGTWGVSVSTWTSHTIGWKESIFVDNTGNVGIGTTAPSYKLDVAGDINTTGDVRKNGTAYTNPDYVFEKAFTGKIEKFKNNPGAKKYKGLKPLAELEAHVKNNHRFPGIEGKDTGIFARQDILLEKLEEAYLYIFELEKRIKKLEAK